MKVVFVSRFPKTVDTPRGGVETATVSLAQSLVDYQGLDVHVVTLERGLNEVVCETHGAITVHRLPRSAWPMMVDVYCGPTAKRLRQYIENLKPDIVHFHETWGMGSYKLNCPTVFTVHGFDSLNLVTEKSRAWRLRSWLWKRVENFGLARQTHIISIAPYVTRQMGTLKAKIYDIWNAINPKYFTIERNLQEPTILFLGWINQRKNPLTLVSVANKLIKQYPTLKVLLCGEVSDQEYGRRIRSTIKALELDACVKMLGRVDMNQVMEKLSQSHVLVLPSLQENAPMVIAEAMAAQVPVVGANLCGIPDMITDEESGYLIEPFDVDGIANRIDQLLGDMNNNQVMGAHARSRAFTLFHPESVASQTVATYRDVIAAYQ